MIIYNMSYVCVRELFRFLSYTNNYISYDRQPAREHTEIFNESLPQRACSIFNESLPQFTSSQSHRYLAMPKQSLCLL